MAAAISSGSATRPNAYHPARSSKTRGFRASTGAQTSHLASHQKNTAWAGFGSVTYAVSDDFTLLTYELEL